MCLLKTTGTSLVREGVSTREGHVSTLGWTPRQTESGIAKKSSSCLPCASRAFPPAESPRQLAGFTGASA